MTQYSPEVEQWRSLVAKYFPAELVDKALYVIQYESGGNPGSVGDGGAARGLFQIQDSRNFSNRPDAAYLDDPERNIAYAAKQLGAASGNWGAWGEGTAGQPAYNPATGKGRFGALGNHPYGGAGMTDPTDSTWSSQQGNQRDPAQAASERAARGRVESLAAQEPSDPNSPAWEEWAMRMDAALKVLQVVQQGSSGTTSASSDPAQQEFNNKISEHAAGIQDDASSLARAQADIDRYFSGLTESTTRSDQIASAQLKGFGYALPNADGSRTMRIDPAKYMQMYDNQFGSTGPAPTIPMRTGGDFGSMSEGGPGSQGRGPSQFTYGTQPDPPYSGPAGHAAYGDPVPSIPMGGGAQHEAYGDPQSEPMGYDPAAGQGPSDAYRNAQAAFNTGAAAPGPIDREASYPARGLRPNGDRPKLGTGNEWTDFWDRRRRGAAKGIGNAFGR